jgi:hypothetical protein
MPTESPIVASLSKHASSARTAIARWCLGLVLASGGAVVWLMIVGAALAFVANQVWSHTVRESRSIVFLESGEPVVRHSRITSGRILSHEDRTVDGQPLEISAEELNRAWHQFWRIEPFAAEPIYSVDGGIGGWQRRLVDVPTPLPWSARLVECSIAGRQDAHWYAIWPDRPEGFATFECYDEKTKSRRGTLGRAGFQTTKIAAEEGFLAWDRESGRVAKLISDPPRNGLPQFGSNQFLLSEDRHPDVGMLWLTPQRDELYLINQTQRSVTLVRTFRDEPLSGVAAKPMDWQLMRRSGLSFNQVMLQPRLLLIWQDRLEFVTPTMQPLARVTLPEELRGRPFQLSVLAAGGYVAEVTKTEKRGIVQTEFKHNQYERELLWFDEHGTISRRVTIELPQVPWNGWFDWLATYPLQSCSPIALMPLSATSLWRTSDMAAFFDASQQSLGDTDVAAWPPEPTTLSRRLHFIGIVVRKSPWSFALCLASGLPFAIACWRRLRRSGASPWECLAWFGLVYLFGLVGWLAFVTHRNWPVRRALPAA